MKSFSIKILLLVFGFGISLNANAQTLSVTEYSLPLEVIQRVDEYVSSLSPEDKGKPFLILRAGWEYGKNSEVAVRIGTQSDSDSLLLSQPGRKISGTNYKMAFAGEARYGARFVEGSHALYSKCTMEEEKMFVVTFRENPKTKIVRTGLKPVFWCISN